jgi:hypothetical protein
MKKIETLFQSGNYDTKHKLNVANTVISENILNEIEHGVTLEQIETLGVPVFKYMTQITIHGLFPQLNDTYVGGYKSIIQNKNLSIGVKWSAVDHSKKAEIYDKVKQYAKWNIRYNSTDYFIYKTSDFLKNKAEYKIELEKAKEDLSHLDKTLFYGNSGVYLSGDVYGYYLVTYINIGGVRKENVNKVIENICNADIVTIDDKILENENARKQEYAEREAKYKVEREKELSLRKPLVDEARQILLNAGYVLQNNIDIQDGLTIIKVGANDNKPEFTVFKYKKEKRQKLFRYTRNETNDISDLNFGYSSEHTCKTTKMTGYVLPKVETKKVETKLDDEIKIIKYSDKCIAVIGDTKPIKDKLKELGGKFNFKLTCGPGWIFTLKKEEELKKLIEND